VLLLIVILSSPLVVAAHYSLRLSRGDYPWNADAIMIPIALHVIGAFPFALLFLVLGLRRYRSGAFLLAWNSRSLWRSVIWTLLLFMPANWAAYMFLEGIDARFYWVPAYFVVYSYSLLVLRACLVSYERDMV
jgi:hypothetical protein